MRYASRADRQAEVSSAEENSAEAPAPKSSMDERGDLPEVPRIAPCPCCGRDVRSHTPRQLVGCRERLDAQVGRRR